MNLDAFLHTLHYDVDRVSPVDWEVDWDDAPLPYKLYRDLPVIPLENHHIGQFLKAVYGLTHVSQTNEMDVWMQSLRRFVPSGGGLYPNELYVYLKVEGFSTGVYHYDVAHHQLVRLRRGNFDDYIEQATGVTSDIGTVFISTMFWKNFYKYNNFAYRLQGLDAGVIIEQLKVAGEHCGYQTKVHYEFLDRAINHLLGLDDQEESVYAVVPLGDGDLNLDRTICTTELCGEIPAIQTKHYMRSKKVLDFPMINQINEASLSERVEVVKAVKSTKIEGEILLPKGERLDLIRGCENRYSPGMDFTMGSGSLQQLATLLQVTVLKESRLTLKGCFYNVEGLPDGAYTYDRQTHALHLQKVGDFRTYLQSGMSAHNVNLYQVPLCFHITGSKSRNRYRDYRIQQMEAGRLVHRLLLAASTLGMNGHPLLGFDVQLCDDIYEHVEDTTLIQIPVGPSQPRSWLRGRLF
ncbi:SagB family peptide dehydrogenase [Pseudalkalibacillus berkeleyi]|uniref:SagB family peptide dehydrogenase n=1 Tax=Pseudalkalibacillus berkeleyi TaxID=1069813 RepID=A0ABS9GYD3_9BACL|nr:SagB family peptide dehydrogenase [Pseudalkalibacillus berkeleyi]MCF6136508.1 SagB family peptide dehydrogenase [Pseudalkalibacillus berkeleyi]